MKVSFLGPALAYILALGLLTDNATAFTSLPDSAIILTPKPGPKPKINGPKIFGARPGNPILFTIPASGDRPMVFSADKLPAGVKLDKNTGQFSGSIKNAGQYSMMLTAQNKLGKVSRIFKL